MEAETLLVIWLIGVPIMGTIGWTLSEHEDKKNARPEFIVGISAFGWFWPIVIAVTFPLIFIVIGRRVRSLLRLIF